MKHRINVSFDEKTYNLITDLASMRGVSRSALIREFFEASSPSLEKAVSMFRVLRDSDPETIRSISDFIGMAEQRALDTLDSLGSEINDRLNGSGKS